MVVAQFPAPGHVFGKVSIAVALEQVANASLDGTCGNSESGCGGVKVGLTRRNPVDDTFPDHDNRCMGAT